MNCAFNLLLLGILIQTYCHAVSIYSFDVQDVEGNEVSLEKYKGKVTLIVNVASHCGYTETTYRAITRLHDILSYGDNFAVLAFPCNQFGEQEPEEAPVIYAAMQEQYFIEFPFFNKIEVTGPNAHPLYKELIAQSSVVPDWNFFKYLVDHNGQVLKAWSTQVLVEDIFDDVEKAIKEAKTADPKKENIPAAEAVKDTLKTEL